MMSSKDGSAECAICLGPFQSSIKVLSCGHSFCCVCLQSLPLYGGSALICPLCRTGTQVPLGAVEKLATNYALEAVLFGNNAQRITATVPRVAAPQAAAAVRLTIPPATPPPNAVLPLVASPHVQAAAAQQVPRLFYAPSVILPAAGAAGLHHVYAPSANAAVAAASVARSPLQQNGASHMLGSPNVQYPPPYIPSSSVIRTAAPAVAYVGGVSPQGDVQRPMLSPIVMPRMSAGITLFTAVSPQTTATGLGHGAGKGLPQPFIYPLMTGGPRLQ